MHSQPARLRRGIAALNHARYHEGQTPYHVISSTLRGEFFIHPCAAVNNIIIATIGRAQRNYPEIQLFAYAFLSNHCHLMLLGPPKVIPKFVGFIKREISRRTNQHFGTSGTLWHRRYSSSALPTPKSQLRCLRYILAQSVKEHIVVWAVQWPGAHCANQLLTGVSPKGSWLNGTAYGKAKHRRKHMETHKRDFVTVYTIQLTPLPAWAHVSERERRAEIKRILIAVTRRAEQDRRRTGRTVLGVEAVEKIPRTTRKPPPRPPWFEHRKRCVIAWAEKNAPETQEYLDRYWSFQRAFSKASAEYIDDPDVPITFPCNAWRPSVLVDPERVAA